MNKTEAIEALLKIAARASHSLYLGSFHGCQSIKIDAERAFRQDAKIILDAMVVKEQAEWAPKKPCPDGQKGSIMNGQSAQVAPKNQTLRLIITDQHDLLARMETALECIEGPLNVGLDPQPVSTPGSATADASVVNAAMRMIPRSQLIVGRIEAIGQAIG